MRRVVITGMGIVSSIGNNTQEVLASLREARSGIARDASYAEHGFRSQVSGAPTLDPEGVVDRRAMRFHGGGTAWNHVAMDQAIQDAGLEQGDVSNERTGIIMGSGGPSTRVIVEAAAQAQKAQRHDEAGEDLQRDVAAQHVAEQTQRQGDRTKQEGHELDQADHRAQRQRRAHRPEQLEEAQTVLGEADDQHKTEGDQGEGGGDGQLRGRREGQEQTQDIHAQNQDEQGEDEREILAAAVTANAQVVPGRLQAAGEGLFGLIDNLADSII
ncbi:hypothetical protein OMR07_30335, partial [Methylobacterium organophilum]|nr:hypothetical protein [Methylobacterium organophilum]